MASTSSDIYALQITSLTDSSTAPNRGDYGGPVHVQHCKITLPSGVADADIFNLMYLPPSAKVIPGMSRVQCSADPGTTLVLDIGTSADPDAFADGIVLSAGGVVLFDSGSTVTAQAVTPAKLSANTLVFATVPTSGASSVTAGVTLTFFIAYTLG